MSETLGDGHDHGASAYGEAEGRSVPPLRCVRVRPFRDADADAIATWEYTGRDRVYNPDDAMMSSSLGYHALVDNDSDEFIGYCCFGPEGRVPGLEEDDAVLDVGVGLRPDLVGGGWGSAVTASVLEYGARLHRPDGFRVAVHAWNERSLRTVRRAGFHEDHRLELADGREFVVLLRGS